MKIGIQTMKNAKYSLEVKESDTVLDVKRQLHSEHALGEADEQKLIYLGKILKDDQTMESAKVKPNDMIVVMLSKKKPAAARPADAPAAAPAPSTSSSTTAAPAPAASATPATPAPAPAVSASTSSPAPATASSPAPAAAPVSASAAAPASAAASAPATVSSTAPAAAAAAAPSSSASATSTLVTGAAYEEAVTNLMSFGFTHDQVVRALRAAFNNADRAAEYLFSGIPPSALAAADAADRRQQQPPAAAAAPAAAGASQSATTSSTAASTTSPPSTSAPGPPAGIDLSALGDLSQLRALLAAQPSMLPLLISQLAQSNPQLVQQLEDNPQAFVQLMQSLGVDPSSLGGGGQLPPDLSDPSGGAGAPPVGPGAGNRTVIQITQEEKDQIDTLAALGFPRDIALEAWLLCDRNQELAAAYLLEHGGEIVMEDEGGYGGDEMGGGAGGGGGAEGDEDDEDINPEDYME